jgi:hypothetical protein
MSFFQTVARDVIRMTQRFGTPAIYHVIGEPVVDYSTGEITTPDTPVSVKIRLEGYKLEERLSPTIQAGDQKGVMPKSMLGATVPDTRHVIEIGGQRREIITMQEASAGQEWEFQLRQVE